jgi:hypothetical protein
VDWKSAIEALGFQIIATTTWAKGVSYEAHYVAGKRKLIKGDVMPDETSAYVSLFHKCEAYVS